MTSQKIKLPDLRAAVKEFAERHNLLESNWLLEMEEIGVFWTACCNIAVYQGISLNAETFGSDPAAGFLLNMLDRTFEHVEAALTAFITGSAASAEVVARTAVESATNVLYILAGDKIERLQAYFNSYFDQVDEQVRKWTNAATKLSGDAAEWQRKGAQHRKIENDHVRKFITEAMSHVNAAAGNSMPKWPNIAEKFDLLGDAIGHRTVYARMCSQTHNDAEDTILYFMAKVSDPNTMEQMGLEAVQFSRLMIYVAIAYYHQASIKFAECFGLAESLPSLKRGHAVIGRQLLAISRNVGSPLAR